MLRCWDSGLWNPDAALICTASCGDTAGGCHWVPPITRCPAYRSEALFLPLIVSISEGIAMAKLDECYQVLGIDPGATPEDVEGAYSELSMMWGPERFPNDDHIRRIAEKKMAEIDAARDALLSFLGSTEKARPPGEIDPGASPLNRVCDNPRCTGVLDRNGICGVCGKRSARDSFRYAVFCSACGTRNVIANQRDLDREVCAGCRRPLGAPVRLAGKSSHKTAYFVLLAVILALALFFFSSEKHQNPASKEHPLDTQASPPSNGTAVDKAQEAHALQRVEPKANRVESTPAEMASGHPTESTGEVAQAAIQSENAAGEKMVPVEESRGAPTEENKDTQPVERAGMIFTPEGKDSKTVEPAGRISANAGKDTAPVEIRPSSPHESGKENYDRLIDEVAKKKAAKPQASTGKLHDLPFGKLNR